MGIRIMTNIHAPNTRYPAMAISRNTTRPETMSRIGRIHGTNEPWTIGTNSSSGCLTNEDIVDLYNRTPIGAKVVVFGTGNPAAAWQ
jgi:lipoprotein-anchoring transpeptidase ErfK/SrfK